MLKDIKQRNTLMGYMTALVAAYMWSFLVLVGIMAVSDRGINPFEFGFWLKLGAAILFMATAVWYLYTRALLQNHDRTLKGLAAKNGWEYHMRASKALVDFGAPALMRLKDARESHFRNLIVSKDFRYADFTYVVYGEVKGWEYKRSIVYYSIVSLELPRSLPNVVFDSRNSRRQQFKPLYAENQLHGLEGDFDTYFATYFINEYTIDSLSFITPEVMEALIAARDYDVEIRDDRLLLYGPLVMGEQQLLTMNDRAQDIKNKLLNNILTYRDERIAYAKGRKTVSATGMSLKLKGFDLRHFIIYNGLFVGGWIILTIYQHYRQ